MITAITTTKRPEQFERLVQDIVKINNVNEVIAFVAEKDDIHKQFSDIKNRINANYSKDFFKLIKAPFNFLFQSGFDTAYNILAKKAKNDTILTFTDSDYVEEINNELFESEIKDIKCGLVEIYMERGNALEKKALIYNKNSCHWYGVVHENLISPGAIKLTEITSLKLKHLNARDEYSKNLKKNEEGFIILEKLNPGSDSYDRNVIYEYHTYMIVNNNSRQMNRDWFLKHYEINKDAVDYYYNEALKYLSNK